MPRFADRSRSVGIALVTAATLAGCSDLYLDRRETVSLGGGDAVALNRVTHMIDPWPPRPPPTATSSTTATRCKARPERYRTGKIIQPKGLGTTASWGRQDTESGGATNSDIGTAKSAK